MRVTTALILACLVAVSVHNQKEPAWQSIVPLRSSRADVERMLGVSGGECRCLYKTEDAVIFIEYAAGPCKGSMPGWNVPADTVLRLTARPRITQQISNLNIDLSKYVISQDDTLTKHYVNREGRVEYGVTAEGLVKSISYVPAVTDKHLRCASFPEYNVALTKYSPFDTHSAIPFEDAKTRLDSFVIQLHENSNMTGYILIYAGRRSRPNEARAYGERARKYLVAQRGLETGRLVIIDGGYREDFTVEMFILPPDLPAPVADPTVAPSEVQIIKRRKP